jgi:hypothetical protein
LVVLFRVIMAIVFELQLCFVRIQVSHSLLSWRVSLRSVERWRNSSLSQTESTWQGSVSPKQGGFAKCYEVTEETTRARYACKVIDKVMLGNSMLKEKLQTEIEIHRQL